MNFRSHFRMGCLPQRGVSFHSCSSAFARHARHVSVFFNEFMRAGPFAEASHGLFVRAADGVFEREAAAEHEGTQVIAKIELMAALRQTADETVRAPVLSDRRKVWKAA